MAEDAIPAATPAAEMLLSLVHNFGSDTNVFP